MVEGGLILPNSLHMVVVLYKQGKTLLDPQLVMDTMLVKNRKNITFRPSLKKAITLRPSNIHKLNYALSVRYVENLVMVPLNVGTFNHAFQVNDIPQALADMTFEDGQSLDGITDTSATAHIYYGRSR